MKQPIIIKIDDSKRKNDIDRMTPIEIGKYLNTEHNRLPVIMKCSKLYDLHYTINNEYHYEEGLTLEEATNKFKQLYEM